MSDPVRLVDDPMFTRDSGIDLSAESSLLAPHDLHALESALHAHLAHAGPLLTRPPSRLVRALAGGRGLVVGLAVGVTVGAVAGAAVHAAWTARTHAPTVVIAPPAPTPAITQGAAPAPAAIAEPPRVSPAIAAHAPPPAAPRTPTPPSAPPVAAAPVGSGAPATPSAAPDDIREELHAYERAEQAMARGLWEVAAAELRASLAAHPHGQLVQESQLSLLEALVRAGHDDDVSALATTLEHDPTLASKRPEILRAHIVALTHRGHCDEARALAAADPRLLAWTASCP
jgi:TolA-binding protein